VKLPAWLIVGFLAGGVVWGGMAYVAGRAAADAAARTAAARAEAEAWRRTADSARSLARAAAAAADAAERARAAERRRADSLARAAHDAAEQAEVRARAAVRAAAATGDTLGAIADALDAPELRRLLVSHLASDRLAARAWAARARWSDRRADALAEMVRATAASLAAEQAARIEAWRALEATRGHAIALEAEIQALRREIRPAWWRRAIGSWQARAAVSVVAIAIVARAM